MPSKAVDKIRQMLQMQDEINSKVHPEWREEEYPWFRAIWTECAELLELVSWKWWKADEPITPAREEKILGEVVDIFHFYLSAVMVGSDAERQNIAEQLASDFDASSFALSSRPYEGCLISRRAEQLIHTVLTYRDNSNGLMPYSDGVIRGKAMVRLCCAVGLDLDQLFVRYVGKNCLNKLRQAHGYKEGTYSRTWAGRDDNDVLVEIQAEVNGLPVDPHEYGDRLYGVLEAEYLSHTAAA